jgi:hypothetical protein
MPATVASAAIVSSAGTTWRVSTRWSTGGAGPTLSVTRDAHGDFLVCD